MQRVAEFVGSTLTNEVLCCLTIEEEAFMGSHDQVCYYCLTALVSPSLKS